MTDETPWIEIPRAFDAPTCDLSFRGQSDAKDTLIEFIREAGGFDGS